MTTDQCPSCGVLNMAGFHYSGCHLVKSPLPRFTGLIQTADQRAACWLAVEVPWDLNRCPYDYWKPERSFT
jgi:hypothetical protein